MKILHFSDTHLGYNNYDKVNDQGVNVREQDFYDAFIHVIDQALVRRPDLIIHSGDFFHKSSPSNRSMTFALEQLQRLAIARIPIVIIAGNHSTPKTIYTSPILKAFRTVEGVYPIFNQEYEYFEFGGVAVHGLPHVNDLNVQDKEIQKIHIVPGKRNILMLHTSLGKRYLMEEYGEQLFPEDRLDVMREFDYIALGHWHNFQKVDILDNAWYSGSTERMSESEISHEKGYCWLDFSSQGRIEPEFHPIPSRPWLRFEMKKCKEYSIEELLQQIESIAAYNDLTDAIVHINLDEITLEQSFMISNSRINEIIQNTFKTHILRKNAQEESYFEKIESGSFDKLPALFAGFVESKIKDPDTAERIIKKSNHYFHIFEQDN